MTKSLREQPKCPTKNGSNSNINSKPHTQFSQRNLNFFHKKLKNPGEVPEDAGIFLRIVISLPQIC